MQGEKPQGRLCVSGRIQSSRYIERVENRRKQGEQLTSEITSKISGEAEM